MPPLWEHHKGGGGLNKLTYYQKRLREMQALQQRTAGQAEVIQKEVDSLERDLLQRYGCKDQSDLQRTLQSLYDEINQKCALVEKILNEPTS